MIMLNVMLADGTVRCADCFDASTYECTTDRPCLYCGSVPQVQEDVSLSKEYGIPWNGFLSQGMQEEYNTYVLEDNLSVLFPGPRGERMARTVYRHLSRNNLNAFFILIDMRDHFNPDTQTMDYPEGR
jgi:hypothetical protein